MFADQISFDWPFWLLSFQKWPLSCCGQMEPEARSGEVKAELVFAETRVPVTTTCKSETGQELAS